MTTEERFTRIESIVERVVDRQEQTGETLATLAESQIKLTESQIKLTEEVAKTQMQVQALGHAVENLERQWQAYLNTIRPQ